MTSTSVINVNMVPDTSSKVKTIWGFLWQPENLHYKQFRLSLWTKIRFLVFKGTSTSFQQCDELIKVIKPLKVQ